jgi:hypothetical protein
VSEVKRKVTSVRRDRWENTSIMDFRRRNGEEWIHLAQNRESSRNVVNTVLTPGFQNTPDVS